MSESIAVPVGVYDSGFGGLTVLRALRKRLPHLDYIYLGDSGRAPYGGRDSQTILDFAEQSVERLFAEGCRVIVVACHTVSCVALRHLQQRYGTADRRVLGVTIPAAEAAVDMTKGAIGFLGTSRTVASHTFRTEVFKLNPSILVREVGAPLLASIVEDALEESEIARSAVVHYLQLIGTVDTLVLGCTHFPLLLGDFAKHAPPSMVILDPADAVAERFVSWRHRYPELAPLGVGNLRILSSGDIVRFSFHGARFFGAELPPVERLAEIDGILALCPNASEPFGQVVRG